MAAKKWWLLPLLDLPYGHGNPFIEPSAGYVLIFFILVEREEPGGGNEERGKEYGLILVRLETALELKEMLTLNL